MAALNAVRASLPPMVGEVLWMSPPIAFTLPGPYVYITRRFIERCTSDASVAFALGHEIAHHDLGHLSRAERWMTNTFAHLPEMIVGAAIEQLVRWLYSRDNEFAADSRALDLCREAGYDLKQCLQCFDVLSRYALDVRDLDEVYGTDEEIEPDPKPATNSLGRIYADWRLWRARHRRSHPSLQERRRVLMSRIASIKPLEASQPSAAVAALTRSALDVASTQTALVPAPAPAPADPPAEVSAGYDALVSTWLNSHKRYPESARLRGEEGDAILHFEVERGGRVIKYAITKSSGYTDLDAAIEQMMRGCNAAPLSTWVDPSTQGIHG